MIIITKFDENEIIFRNICQEICVAEIAYAMVAAIKFNELKNKYEWTDTYFEELFDFVPANMKFDFKGLPFRYND